MQLNKIIYDIRETLKSYTEDNELDNRYLIHLLNLKRAKYLRQELNNYQRTTDVSVTQTLCLELEEVSSLQCGINISCEKILRTKKPIPQPLELHIKSSIINIKSSKRLDIPFNFISKEKAVYSKYSPFNKSIYVYLDNDKHLYLISELNTLNLIDCITVTGIFEDPLELKNYYNCCECETPSSCFDEEISNYPLQPHYIDLIKSEISKELILNLKTPEDTVNDDSDN